MATLSVADRPAPIPRDAANLVDVLRWRARHEPDRPAHTFLTDPDDPSGRALLTYGALDRRARAIAARLQQQGAQGTRALLVYDPGLEYIAAVFGCLYAGVIAVPVYPPDPLRFNRTWPRLQAILRDAQASWVLSDATILTWADTSFGKLPHVEVLLATDEVSDDAHRDWRPPAIDPHTLALLQYTSGSTGAPKGVMISHGNLIHNVSQMHRLDSPDVIGVIWLPPYHDMGLIGGVLLPVFSGRHTVLMSPLAFVQRPFRWLKAISDYRAKTSGAPNFGYDLCVRKISADERKQLDLNSWSLAFSGAEPVRAETIDRFVETFAPCGLRRETFYPCYGLAEATLFVSGGRRTAAPVVRCFEPKALEQDQAVRLPADDPNSRILIGNGQCVSDQTIKIVDPQTELECAAARVGEIWIAGPSVAQGYWNRPRESAATFGARIRNTGEGPFLRSGDLGFLDGGELFITGRLKDLIIVAGRNHYPQDIELSVQHSHEALRPEGGAVFSVEVNDQERVVVVQEVARPKRFDLDEIIGGIRRAVAQEHDLPVYAVVLIKASSLSKTTSGKIQRRACRNLFTEGKLLVLAEWRADQVLQRAASNGEARPPLATPTESRLAELWRELLAVEIVSPEDDFFAFGGHSLLVIQLVARIGETFGVELPPEAAFVSPTLGELASRIDEAREASSAGEPVPIPRAPRDGRLPLSFGQQRLWFLDQLERSQDNARPAIYHIAFSATLDGKLDAEALQQSLQALLQRHESLRTTFHQDSEGVPFQRIAHKMRVPLQRDDLSGLPRQRREEALAELARRLAERPFDLARGPLVRARLVRLEPKRHALVMVLHHLIVDGYSLGVLVKEWSELYEAFVAGSTSTLAEPKLQNADFAAWQQSELTDESLKRELDYWTAQLADVPLLELPADRSPKASEPFRGEARSLELGAELTADLEDFSRRRGVTPYMTLVAALDVLLWRYTGQTDLVIGSPIAGRMRRGLEDVVGFLANTLLLRSDLSAEPTFEELLEQVRRRALEAYAHSRLPLEKLVDALKPARQGSDAPLFNVMFALEELPPDGTEAADIRLSSVEIDYRYMAPFDWSLFVERRSAGLRSVLTYDSTRFDAATIDTVLEGWQALLTQIVRRPDAPIGELPVMSGRQRRELLETRNDTTLELPDDRLAHELFEVQAERTPQQVAVEFEGRTLTYAELDRRATRLAEHLTSLGVGPEVLVGIYAERSLEMLVGVLGVLKAGGAYLPLDPAFPAERIAFMLEDSNAAVLLTQRRLVGTLSQRPPEVVLLDEELPTAGSNGHQRGDGRARRQAAKSNGRVRTSERPTSEQLAYVIYTSGSTGKPKGVQIPHRALVNFLVSFARRPGLTADDVLVAVTTLSFDIAALELLLPLIVGAKTVIVSREVAGDPRQLAVVLQHTGATVMQATPTTWRMLVDADWQPAEGFRRVFCGGEPLPAALARRLTEQDIELWNFYGPTETTIWSTIARIEPGAERITIGRPIANTEVYVLDTQRRPLPPGAVGELYIGGLGLARGYLNRPELSAERFVRHPLRDDNDSRLYRTGDLARWRTDGQLECLGRTDHQLKLRGFRVEPGEIETALLSEPEVRAAVVIAYETAPGDHRLVAYYVSADGTDPGASELKARLARRLPNYMVPSHLVPLDELPQLPNGKLDRAALPAPGEMDAAAARDAGASTEGRDALIESPETETERRLAAIWECLLGVKHVGRHDNFFDLGGHSLLATQLISRIRNTLDIELPLRAAFEAPTLDALAARIEAERSRSALPRIEPVSRDGEIPLSFAQQRLWFIDQLEPQHPFYNLPVAARMRGRLDVDALARALGEVVRRHESLRTTFTCCEGRPEAHVQPDIDVPLDKVDLSGLDPAEQEAQVQARLTEYARRPFDLERGPLLRSLLVRLGEEDHVVLLSMHHIVSDGWSMGVLLREMTVLYEAFRRGHESPLAPLPLGYGDFAAWQQKWLSGETLNRQLAYWEEQLSGSPPLLELPTDKPRPPIPSFHGATEPLELSAELTARLESLARGEGVTLYMLLLSAFNALLSRYSGQDDICVGTPIANRTREELEGLVGFFVNTLVLRTDLSGDPRFDELLQRVRDITLEAYAHQDVPYEKVVEALQPRRSRSHAPLFQVAFVYQNAPLELPAAAGSNDEGALGIRPIEVHNGTAKYDLTLFLWQDGGRLRGRVEYNTDVFEGATVARLGRHLERLLEAVSANPAETLSRLPLLSDVERERILGDWSASPRAREVKACVHEMFEAQVRRTPDAVAVEFQDQRVTYRELNERANRLAHQLRRLGVAPEVIVGLALERSVETFIALLGIMKAGGAFVPLDADLPKRRLELILAETQAPVVLTQESLAGRFDGLATQLVFVEESAEVDDNAEVVSRSKPDHLAYVIYTSGSTGTPKGVLIEHGNLAGRIVDMLDVFHVDANTRFLQFASLSFDASLPEIFTPLVSGGTICLPSTEERMPGAPLTRYMREKNVTIATLPPSVVAVMPDEELPSLQTLVTAGEPCSEKIVARWAPGRRFLNAYGPTETTIGATWSQCTDGTRNPHIGRPFPDTEIYILDEHRQPLPVGVPGELYIGGGVLGRGYLNRPELTRERFVLHPFSTKPGARLYRSGDRVRWLSDGNVDFLGRVDDQIKLHGFRIEPGEIANLLKQHEGIGDAAVLAREDTPGDKRLVAYVVPQQASAPDMTQNGSVHRLESEQVDQWKTVFDENYRRVVPHDDATFNIAGWNSSYTSRPMPADHMREWVDQAVARILQLKPKRVLEIGCGSGLLLFRIAPHCDVYWGTDLSPDALHYVERTMAASGGVGAQTRLLQQAADNFDGLEPESFDVVVLNSVVQYFPSADYLVRVLKGAARLVRPGGQIFLGDVRSLPLLEAFHTSVELFGADGGAGRAELFERVRRRVHQEQELAVDPALFEALVDELPDGGEAEVLLKRGRHHNELTKFRYDVILHVGAEKHQREETCRLAWEAQSISLARLEEILTGERPLSVELTDVPNARVWEDVRAARLLGDSDGPVTVDALRTALAEEGQNSIDPDAIWALGERLGYDVRVTRSRASAVDRFDAELIRSDSADSGYSRNGDRARHKNGRPARKQPEGRRWRDYANNPLQAAMARTLVPEWKRHLEERLPAYMLPSAFVVLERLPLLRHGKLDRRALPPPSNSRPAWSGRFVAPRDELECQVAQIWEELLGVQPIGVTDNFFELGGHSMLAVRLVARVEQQCGRKLSLASLFHEPTVEYLAELLRRRETDEPTSALVPLQPHGGKRPLFLVHPAGGTVFCYLELARHLGTDQPVFGLQAQGLDGEQPPHTRVEDMAEHYISAIRAVQPDGPYMLGGWSLGGNLAFEVACRLEQQEEQVALLALLDAGTMSDDRPPREEDFLPVLMGLFPNEQLPSLEALRQMAPADQLGEFLQRAQQAQLAAPEFDTIQGRHLFEVFQANFKAMLEYRPGPFAGKVTLFCAGRQASPMADDPTLGWGAVAQGGVEVHTIDCDHVHMVREPNVAELVQQLKRAIDSAQTVESLAVDSG